MGYSLNQYKVRGSYRQMSASPKESLFNIPLVKQMLNDPATKMVPRAIDQDWHCEKKIPISVVGFNPLQSSVFYGTKSRLSEWIKNPKESARRLNDGDQLVLGLLLAVHDYLHCWAYLAINEMAPKLRFGTKKLTSSNIEDFVFCHLLSEAVATVGLDYWYLSNSDLNEVCDVGTNCRHLAVHYDERDLPEYQKFNSKLKVMEPAFFKSICSFYCTGNLPGFNFKSLCLSAKTRKWLQHEIDYGAVQRKNTRLWLSFLAGGQFEYSPLKLTAPLKIDLPWKKKLIAEMQELLWDKVVRHHTHSFKFRFDDDEVWSSPETRHPDFRFLNWSAVSPKQSTKIAAGPNSDENFRYFFYQFASQFSYEGFDLELIKLFETLIFKKDFELISYLFRDQNRVSSQRNEPKDLLFLN